MTISRRFFLLGAPVALGACSATPVWAPDEAVNAVRFRASGPPGITLFTMVNNRSGQGAHSSLMVSASERVIFDPAGTVVHDSIPERNDVLFGITPSVENFYTRAHARETYHVMIQRVTVSPEVAERALLLVLNYGAVPSAYCTQATSGVLRQLPGFEDIRQTWFPVQLAEQFGTYPGVTTKRLYEYDEDDKSIALRAYDPEEWAAQYQ